MIDYMKSRSSPDCFTVSCSLQTIIGGKGFTDLFAETIIFKKLLASLHFVKDINDAELVLVPVLGHTSITIGPCNMFGKCRNAWYSELMEEIIKQKLDASKQHMYLVSQDFSQGHPFFRREYNKGHIVMNLVTPGIVIPSFNP